MQSVIENHDLFKRRWLPWLALILMCNLFGLIDAFQGYVAANSSGGSIAWSRVYPMSIIGWNLWVLFVPLILRLVRRFPLARDTWRWTIVIFTVVGIVIALARAVIPVLMHFFVIYNSRFLRSYLANKYFDLISDFLLALVVFGLVFTFGQALNYYKQYRENELKASRLAAQLAQSQLQALKMQIHPHFLFNTLNAISSLQLEDPKAAQKMTARLGDFLRLTLENTGTHEVTLKREIEFLNCYLDIQRVRFGDRLTTTFNIEPESLDALLPNLILQPIVENAFQHGISQRIGPGSITVVAQRSGKALVLQVRDNGPGLTKSDKRPLREGLGVANTRARLEQLYGAACNLELKNAREGGLVVTMEIPFSTNGKNSDG